ncbi:MAG: OmpA family protein [Bacteroidales bacterium]|nr:OmpA family protein [Bacteroidales bacterium]
MKRISKILKPLLLTFFIITSYCMSAQSFNTSSKKALKYFQKAIDVLYEDLDIAMKFADNALKHDNNFADAILLKAEIYLEMKNDSSAIAMYEQLFEVDSTAFPTSAISLSKLYAKHFDFDKSISLLDWYLSSDNQKETTRNIAKELLTLTKYQKELVDNPVDYKPYNIGNSINTSDDEYVNQYYVNEGKMIFTKKHESEENVFVSIMYDSVWLMPYLLFGNYKDIGAANITADGKEIYFSASSWSDGKGSNDIYHVKFENGKWSKPKNLKSINTSDWESQPCISFDGKDLYFVRRNKKHGTSDIYVASRDDDGDWNNPHKLNFNINTEGNEMAPFIYYDGMTLYFSSDKRLGMGGYDLFMSRRDENGDWTEAVNLGYPLNTAGDEINIVISNNANTAYISAVRNEGYGGYDIYEFELDERFMPQPIDIELPSVEEFYANALEKNETVILKNIYFAFDSSELTEDSDEGIAAIYNFLLNNKDVTITLEGHTDDIGNEEYNMLLSERRAASVRQALIDKGINGDRIKTKGCGSTQPLFPNNFDDELKFLNRRVSMSFDF